MEVLVRAERRRSWSPERKREIVAEMLEGGGKPGEVARRHSISSGQLYTWRRELFGIVSAASDLGRAIRYALRDWAGLAVFLDDGRVEMDTNAVERAIRPSVLTRKNALFAGSDDGARHWAMAMTWIQTAKLNGVEPMAWLTDVLERVVSGRTRTHELHTLLPWNWATTYATPEAEPLAA